MEYLTPKLRGMILIIPVITCRGGLDRYTSRFFLKHTSLEQAFDMLLDQGFVMASSCGTGTSTSVSGNDTPQPLSPDRYAH